MGRNKKDAELQKVEESLDLDEEHSDEQELAAEEKAPDIAADSGSEEIEEKTKKPRRTRSRKTAAPVVEVGPLVEMQNVAAVENTVPNDAPKDAPKDAIVLQWEAARQTSESILASLEKVDVLLRDIPEHYATAMQKALKQPVGKALPAARIAFGMSLFATVLSVLSISFSQSARQSALSHAVSIPAVHAPAPVKPKTETADAKKTEEPKYLAVKKVRHPFRTPIK